MQCPYCRKITKDNLKECSYCGATLPTKPAPSKKSNYNNSYSNQNRPYEPDYRNNQQVNSYRQPQTDPNAGKGAATASLVFGIIGIVGWFLGELSFISIIVGIIGLCLANSAKKAGNTSGIRVAGFVMSLITLIFGSLIFIACVTIFAGVSAALGSL